MSKLFKSKHTIAALIVAPVLAIGSWLAIDFWVGEQPQKAEAGRAYALVALPNCRYSSGKCTLKNNEFKLELTPVTVTDSQLTFLLTAAYTLEDVHLALVNNADDSGTPVAMQAVDAEGRQWQLTLTADNTGTQHLRLVAQAAGAHYYGETGLAFVQYQTSFQQDFR